MKFIVFNESKKENIVMIPPGGLDERCFSHVLPYLQDYRVIIPVLDGNVIGENSTLPDRKTEADRIIDGLKERNVETIRVLQGISYGATLALEVVMRRKFVIKRTVLDGGSFLKYGFIMKTANLIGTKAYVSGIKRNPDKPSMYASLGEDIDRCGREVFAHMSEETLKQLITDSMSGVKVIPGGVKEEDHVVVTYGAKDSYKGGLKWFKKSGFPYESEILNGYGHCRYFAEKPEEYVKRYYMLD